MNIYNNATEAFESLYDGIMTKGKVTKVGTRRFKDCSFYIKHPDRRVITTPWRKFSQSYAEREYQWYISGNPSVSEIKKYAKMWDTMHGGDDLVNSNYGYQWKRGDQLERIIDMLSINPCSRRAWITIYDGKELNKYEYDTPCTLSVGFEVFHNRLDMQVLMRSNDLVLGFCNDQYCWTKLQEAIAKRLNLKLGSYFHYAHDLHIYERHWSLKQKYYDNKTNH